MGIRIKCPSCTKEFSAGEDLKGRTVECGVCEEHFAVDDSVLVRQKKRYYPGEKTDARLDQFSRTSAAGGASSAVSQKVDFQQANYNDQPPKFNAGMPMSPAKLLAVTMGVSVALAAAFALYIGSSRDSFLTDMLMDKRLILFGFIAALCALLIIYGSFKRFPIRGILLALLIPGGLVYLTTRMPVYETVPDEIAFAGGSAEERESKEGQNSDSEVEQDIEDLKKRIGYDPVQRAIERSEASGKSVDAILVLNMKESSKFTIMDYLARATGMADRPACYDRDIVMNDGSQIDAGIILLEDHNVTSFDLEEICGNFGTVDKKASQPDLKLLVVFLDTEAFGDISPELQARMIDPADQLFYELNYKELASIEIVRVKAAAARLATADPLLHRKKIAHRLVNLIKESRGDDDFEKSVCVALQKFIEKGDGCQALVNEEASRQMIDYKSVSRPLVELLITIGSPDSIPMAQSMWASNPLTWEPTVSLLGKKAKPILLKGLQSNDAMIQKSAVRLIRNSKLTSCLSALQSAMSSATPDVRNEINSTIQILRAN